MSAVGHQAFGDEVNSRGSAALYVLLLFPVVLALTTVAVDVSGWNALRDELQKEADSIALQAAQALPDRSAALLHGKQALLHLTAQGTEGDISFPDSHSGSLRVTLRATYRSSFDILLRNTANPDQHPFRVERSGTVQQVPTDAIIIMADGQSLRPGVRFQNSPENSRFDAAWGSPLDWPAASYFQCVTPPKLASVGSLWDWWNHWASEDFQRWATQACFNPVLSSFKYAAMSYIDSILATPTNRLGVIFTPGDQSGRGFSVARHLHSENENAELYAGRRGGFPEPEMQTADAHWNHYLELERLLSNETCMLFADPLVSVGTPYEIVESTLSTPSERDTCGPALRANPCGREHEARGHLSGCYQEQSLRARETVYWHAAKLAVPGFAATPDIRASLQQAWHELTTNGAEPGSKYEQSKRGNLAFSSLRRVVVMTDSLPEIDSGTPSFAELLSYFLAQNIQVTFVAFGHAGLSAEENETLQSRAEQIRRIGETSENNPSRIAPRVFYTNSSSELQEVLGPSLASLGRQFAIRR